jgi:5-hydroxyisourate hydrolase
MTERSPITSHVLDTARGCPAGGITAKLEYKSGSGWRQLGQGTTNDDGRIADLLPVDHKLELGTYQLTFDTATYFDRLSVQSFYPHVTVMFEIKNVEQHYHVPLLLSPFGYSTYRGS